MHINVEFVTVPTADTPGTLLSLQFGDGSKYLIGRVSEGSSRACSERALSLSKVAGILVTGTTQWSNVGGFIGLLLSVADSHTASKLSVSQKGQGPPLPDKPITVFSPPNLNHVLAAARKYIFRTGIPLSIDEAAASSSSSTNPNTQAPEPTWKNDHMLIWALPILPTDSSSSLQTSPSRKRTFDQASSSGSDDEHVPATSPSGRLSPPDIVSLMFNSKWSYGKLFPQPLSTVGPSTAVYVQDPNKNEFVRYTGPRPTADDPGPDITVFARAPWPGSAVIDLPKTQPAPEALSYIFRFHPQRGKFLPAKAIELKVPRGPLWNTLTKGSPVQNSDGDTITPEMVLEPGQQGSGFAVIDIPGPDYIDGLVSRPEWKSAHVIDEVKAIIWILPADLWHDPRLQAFRTEHSHMQHILSSPDSCANSIAFERASVTAMRHRLVDDKVFADIQQSSHDRNLPDAVVAQRGLSLHLQPVSQVSRDLVLPPLDLVSIQNALRTDFEAHSGFDASWKSNDPALVSSHAQLQPYGDVQIVVLGTGSSHPTPYRNVSGTLVHVPQWGNCFLDCGEGTLNNLRRIMPPQKVLDYLLGLKMVWISHLHADHHLGTISVIKAWIDATASDPSKKLAIVSHWAMLKWLTEYSSVENLDMSRIDLIYAKPDPQGTSNPSTQTTKLQVYVHQPAKSAEVSVQEPAEAPEDWAENLGLQLLNAVYVSHCNGAMAVSITFKTGFKISYSGDCLPSSQFAKQGVGSHVLVHEATLEDELRAEAMAKKHSTPGGALVVAAEMKASLCLLTHFSQRYPQMPPLGGLASSRNNAITDGLELKQVLSNDLSDADDEPEAGLTDVSSLEPMVAATAAAIEGDDPAVSHLIEASVRAEQGHHTRKADKPKIIDKSAVQALIEEHGIRVLCAFDYMCFTLADVPRVEAAQPLLRQIYDLKLGHDVLANWHKRMLADKPAALKT